LNRSSLRGDVPSDAAGRQASFAETQAHANVRENKRQG
jgi:hypothetical protein